MARATRKKVMRFAPAGVMVRRRGAGRKAPPGEGFFCRFLGVPARQWAYRSTPMRFLLTYLVVVIVFAFGFLCAAAFTMGED